MRSYFKRDKEQGQNAKIFVAYDAQLIALILSNISICPWISHKLLIVWLVSMLSSWIQLQAYGLILEV